MNVVPIPNSDWPVLQTKVMKILVKIPFVPNALDRRSPHDMAFLPLLTPEEACLYLRLDVDRSMSAALKSLSRLVEKRILRPCIVGKKRRYARYELDLFIMRQTDRWASESEVC